MPFLWRLSVKNGAIEILYIFENNVLECSTSIFFLIKNNTVITPKKNILLGITRNFILNLVMKEFSIEERDIHFDELARADEAFITATNKEVLPIVQIDSTTIGNEKIGKNTKKIMEMFAAAIRSL